MPHHSARIQLCPEALHDPKHGSTFVSMVHNLLGPLQCHNILHVEVNFCRPPSKKLAHQLDAAIGRFAHIAYLEQTEFITMFVQMYLKYLV